MRVTIPALALSAAAVVAAAVPAATPALAANLIARWAGTRWVAVASLNVACCDNGLNGVFAASERDVWPVGGNADLMYPIIEHWNGRKWRVVAS